jgi:putative ABC transport system ATP-binding protein
VSLIEFRSVEKWYRMGELRVPALRDINLRIEPGEFIAVWGPSGSGKSTLCNLAGLIDEANEGELWFRGQDAARCSDDQRSELRSRHIGFVFQSFNLVPVFSALENALLPLQLRGAVSSSMREQAMELLATVGLHDQSSRWPDELSGGQQQRVAIVRALITDPDLVIADEPTANLDTVNARAIIDIMHEKNRSQGTTFLFSTHDERLLDRVERRIHLRDGLVANDERSPRQL